MSHLDRDASECVDVWLEGRSRIIKDALVGTEQLRGGKSDWTIIDMQTLLILSRYQNREPEVTNTSSTVLVHHDVSLKIHAISQVSEIWNSK